MSFSKIVKKGSGKYVWSVYIIINNFGSFQVVQVLKFQNIKLIIICIWIFIVVRVQCFSLLYFEGFLVVLSKWDMWFPKLSNHIINEAERGHSRVLIINFNFRKG